MTSAGALIREQHESGKRHSGQGLMLETKQKELLLPTLGSSQESHLDVVRTVTTPKESLPTHQSLGVGQDTLQ